MLMLDLAYKPFSIRFIGPTAVMHTYFHKQTAAGKRFMTADLFLLFLDEAKQGSRTFLPTCNISHIGHAPYVNRIYSIST